MPVELMEKIGGLLDDADLLALAATCRPVRQRLGAMLQSVDLRRRMEASLTGSGLSQAMDSIDKIHPPARKALWATAVTQVSRLPPADAAHALEHAHQRLWAALACQPAAGRAERMSALFQQLAARLSSLADDEQFRQSARMLERWARAWTADELAALRYRPDDLLFDVDETVLHQRYRAYVDLSGQFPPDVQFDMLASLPLPDLQRLAPVAQQAAIERLIEASSTLHAAARTLLLHRLDWTVAGLLHLPDQDGMRERIADLLVSAPG